MVDVKSVLSNVVESAASCGRSGLVDLMAVSKTHPYEDVLDAYAQGQRLFGENRVQEIEAKFPPKGERPEGLKLCLIGHLQRNKAKKAITLVDRIDSVDSFTLCQTLEKELAKTDSTLEILFEFNSSGEEQKSGFESEDELLDAASRLKTECPHLSLVGLMTVGPLGHDEEKNRDAFTSTARLFEKMKGMGYNLSVLSMGMSGDYKTAIECGSTEVRIGTAIFGERNYSV